MYMAMELAGKPPKKAAISEILQGMYDEIMEEIKDVDATFIRDFKSCKISDMSLCMLIEQINKNYTEITLYDESEMYPIVQWVEKEEEYD
jgi:hypothetical protein